jgi:hypothetical protein
MIDFFYFLRSNRNERIGVKVSNAQRQLLLLLLIDHHR